ncbi:MAG: hypothetical protein GWN01_09945, partial [Nitrosopumilaceae archaeon]|nr:hypothetical protein [Nitrosopumilaceae archaeon]NIU87581.1 hypothetical protein [Nitrosopumilaceae archaeon]NIX61829.1 hypothetical protein [Nitrosopumilaceae archaeon]
KQQVNLIKNSLNQFDILKKNLNVELRTDFMLKCSISNNDENHEIIIRTTERIEDIGNIIPCNKLFQFGIDLWVHNITLTVHEGEREIGEIRYKMPRE